MATEFSFELNSTEAQQPFTEQRLGFPPGNVFITVEDADIRFWYGGSTPTAASGHKLFIGVPISFTKTSEIVELRLISTGGIATVHATVGGV